MALYTHLQDEQTSAFYASQKSLYFISLCLSLCLLGCVVQLGSITGIFFVCNVYIKFNYIMIKYIIYINILIYIHIYIYILLLLFLFGGVLSSHPGT